MSTLHSSMAEDRNADRGSAVVAVCWVLFSFLAITLLLRFASRKLSQAGFWWDDWLALLCVIWVLVDAIITTVDVFQDGLGRHLDSISSDTVVAFLKIYVTKEIIYVTCIATTKLSILLYLWRIFNVSSMRVLIYVGITIVGLWWLGSFTIVLRQCLPLSALWNPSTGTCISDKEYFLGVAIPNIITDFMMMLLPIAFIWQLNMKTWQKIGLTLTFAVGSLVMVISIVRTGIAVAHFTPGQDVTWIFVTLIQWSTAELYLASAVANLPSLGPLIRWVRARKSGNAAYAVGSSSTALDTRMSRAPNKTGVATARRLDSGESGPWRNLGDEDEYNVALRDFAA